MISYFFEDTHFKFSKRRLTNKWLKSVVQNEGLSLGDINIIFTSDDYLLKINQKYLNHNYFTDIITFDYREGDVIVGDLFISVDSVKDNSSFYGTSFDNELMRVIVHGVLHIIGYDDHTPEDVKVMRSKEDFYLNALNNLIS